MNQRHLKRLSEEHSAAAALLTADRYLGEAFISHSLGIKLIQNLLLPKCSRLAVKCDTVFVKLSWQQTEAQLLGLHHVPLVRILSGPFASLSSLVFTLSLSLEF